MDIRHSVRELCRVGERQANLARQTIGSSLGNMLRLVFSNTIEEAVQDDAAADNEDEDNDWKLATVSAILSHM